MKVADVAERICGHCCPDPWKWPRGSQKCLGEEQCVTPWELQGSAPARAGVTQGIPSLALGTARCHLSHPCAPLCPSLGKPSQQGPHPPGWLSRGNGDAPILPNHPKTFQTLKGELCHTVGAKVENSTGVARAITQGSHR